MQSSKATAGSLTAAGAKPAAAFEAAGVEGNGVQYLPPASVMFPLSAAVSRLQPPSPTAVIVARATTNAIFLRTGFSLGCSPRQPGAVGRTQNRLIGCRALQPSGATLEPNRRPNVENARHGTLSEVP